MKARFLLLALAALQIGAAKPPQSTPEISVVRLVANPAAYAGRRVRVEGFLSQNFEDYALYPGAEAREADLSRSAILVEPPPWDHPRKAYRAHYATVEGTFSTNDWGRFAGSLINVTRINLKQSRREFYEDADRTYARIVWPRLLGGLLLASAIAYAAGRWAIRR